jgi:hypothetical protein
LFKNQRDKSEKEFIENFVETSRSLSLSLTQIFG